MADLLVLGSTKKLEKNLTFGLNRNFHDDRFSEPCFAVVTIVRGSHWGTGVYNHNLQLIGRAHYQDNWTWGQAIGGCQNQTGTEGGNSYCGHAQTDSHAGGNSSYGPLTCKNTHLGHTCIEVAPNGTLCMRNNDHVSQAARNVGTWLHNTTPDMAIFQQSNYHYTGPRSMPGGWPMLTGKDTWKTDRFHGNDDFSTVAKFGLISYNEQTKKLAIGESSHNYYIRFHVYSEVQPPASFAVKQDFWNTTNINPTKKVVTGWSDWRPTANGSEDNYRAVVVLCDNNDIVFHRMIPHWGAYCCKFTYNSTTGQYNTFGGSATAMTYNWTTSYGMDSGPAYGVRFQISNSGKYVLAYNSAYYYGCGFQATLIRVSDGKRLYAHHPDSTYGAMFVPWKDDYFAMSREVNNDGGPMLYFYTINPIQDMKDVADKGAFVWNNVMQYTFDAPGHHSTNYPYIVPIMSQNYYKFVQ